MVHPIHLKDLNQKTCSRIGHLPPAPALQEASRKSLFFSRITYTTKVTSTASSWPQTDHQIQLVSCFKVYFCHTLIWLCAHYCSRWVSVCVCLSSECDTSHYFRCPFRQVWRSQVDKSHNRPPNTMKNMWKGVTRERNYTLLMNRLNRESFTVTYKHHLVHYHTSSVLWVKAWSKLHTI